jgi:beta-1,2-mannosidase
MIRGMLRSSRAVALLACGLACATAAGAVAWQPRLGPWVRLNDGRPLLSPRGSGFEAAGVFNPAIVKVDEQFVMLYRAQDKQGTSRLGYATSRDGVTFERDPEPVLSPEADYERGGGVEDPRLVRIGETYYLTYTAYNGKDAQLALATSRDLRRWERLGVIMPANTGGWNVHWTKSGAIVNQPIDDRYWMYYMADAKDASDQTGIASSTDLRTWTEALDRPVLPRRPGRFDSRVVEPGPPPILMKEGILLLYNGADDHLVYRTGWALFDRANPTRLLARSDEPLFEPTTEWEKTGQVPNVVFVEGLIIEPSRWLAYYGAADTHIGVASIAIPEN